MNGNSDASVDNDGERINLAVLTGTARVQRRSDKAARYIADFAAQLPGVDVTLVDPKDFTFPGDGNDPEGKDARYGAIVAGADAFFIVTPEYNHSFPGSLKRMLDSELALYNHKPVAIAGVSDGNWGGVRAVEQLHVAVRELGLVSLSWDVYFPRIQDIFNEAGGIQEDSRERYQKSLTKIFDELLLFARLFKTIR
jgi:NAD(P)H-dependent FMN reductase